MRSFESRVLRLEARLQTGSKALLATLLRLFAKHGSMRAAVAAHEADHGKKLAAHPAILKNVERTGAKMANYVREMKLATDGTRRAA